MPLELTNPSGLWLLSLLAPLVALYLLRARRTRKVVPSLLLWREAERNLAAERPLRRLLPEAPLLLEAVMLLFLALALAAPARKGTAVLGDRVAIVVDTSASMSTTDDGHTRLDRARVAAKNVVRHLAPGAEAIVVDAGKDPHVVGGFERDPHRLLGIVDSLAARDEEGELGKALGVVSDRLASGPSRRIIVVTDVNADVPALAGIPLEVVRVGSPADNVALSGLTVQRSAPAGATRERANAFALVENFGASPAERFVTLKRRGDDHLLASRRVKLAPGERAGISLGFEPNPMDTGTGVVVELTPGDSLANDDRAYALIPPGPRLPVVLTPPDGDPWLRRALAADPDVELFETPLAALGSGDLARDALVVSVGACPASPPLGDVLIVAPPPGDCMGLHVGEIVRAPTVTSWSDRDARFRFLSLSDLHIREGRNLEAPRGSALLGAGNATLVADLGLPRRSGTVVSFDLGDSDWPLRASFVLFVRNVTEQARADRARTAGIPERTGELLRIPVPLADGNLTIREPTGDLPARLSDGLAVGEAPSKTGFYDVIGGPRRSILASAAVNFESRTESDLRRVPSTANSAATGTRSGITSLQSRGFSWACVLCGLACVLAEAYWFTRRSSFGSRRTFPLPSRLVFATTSLAALAMGGYALLLRSGLASERFLRFERPGWTFAAILGVAAVGVAAFRTPASPRPLRRAFVEAGAALAALALGIGAAEPAVGAGKDRLAVIVAMDRSRSTDLVPGADARLEEELARASAGMRTGDRLAVVAFASEAVLEQPLHGSTEPPSPERAALGRDGTNLAAGIRRALAEAPSDSSARIALISDGVATRGDTTDAALSALLAGVPVDVVPLEQREQPSVRVASVRAPERADANESIDLRVTTRSTRDSDLEVRVLRDGEPRSVGRRRIHAGEDVFWIRERADEPGLHRYDVHVTPLDATLDSIPEDNDGSAFVRVTGRARALVIESDPARVGPLRSALSAASFDVDVVPATRAPASLDEFARNDLLVLGNVPASDLSTEQIGDLSSYSRDLGGGLLLMGGDRSMGPGGYARTPLADVSPVSFELPNERRKARLAEVIAIDTSGSMSAEVGEQTKLSLANEAAARSAELLGPADRIGVEHVDTTVTWTVPIATIADPTDIGRRIRSAGSGGGGIFVNVALEAAYAALDRESVEMKHVLLFADGDDAEEKQGAAELALGAFRRGITTSVVALGRGQDIAALERISRDGKGRFYLIEDATRLPAVFAEETTIAAGNAIRETTFHATPGVPDSATRGVELNSSPPLSGYVVTTAKPRTEVSLFAADRDPLLATWAVGVGRVGAFTSDYGAHWGASWASWSDAAKLFAQLGRDLARRLDDPSVTLDAEVSGGALVLRADAVTDGGAEDSFRNLTATVAGPDGFSKSVALEPNGPGSYAAKIILNHPGGYVAEVHDDRTGSSIGSTGAVLSVGEELEPTGTDHATLARVARLTGGRVRANLDAVFRDRPPPRRVFRPLLPWLAVIGAVAMLCSVASRRLPLGITGVRWPVSSNAKHLHHADDGAPVGEAAALSERPLESPDPVEPGAAPTTTTAEVLLARRRRRQ